MSAVPVPNVRRVGGWLRSVAETVYYAPSPASGVGLAAKARRTAYVVGSALAWTLATLLVVGVLASLLD